MAEEWKIQRDRTGCDKPGCPLPTSASWFAVLLWPACQRRDLCDACFQDYENGCAKGEPPIFWRALRRPGDKKAPVLDLQSLRLLFDRLGSVEDDRARALRYFCALLLLQKRMLRMVPPRTAEQERADLVVVDPKLKEMEPVSLFAPAIDTMDLGAVKDELLVAIGTAASPAEEA